MSSRACPPVGTLPPGGPTTVDAVAFMSIGRLPALVGCAHGTGDEAGKRALAELLVAVQTARPEVEVQAAFVDVQEPRLTQVLAGLDGRPAVVVPLLLSRGYHVGHDIAAAVTAHRAAVASPPLGPDPVLADLLVARLGSAGATSRHAVVLAAAGSSDPSAAEDVEQIAALLAERLHAPVTYAFASAAQPRIEDEV